MDLITEREKRVYKLSKEDFLKGEWLDKVRDLAEGHDKIEMRYINGILSIVFFNKENILQKKPLKE